MITTFCNLHCQQTKLGDLYWWRYPNRAGFRMSGQLLGRVWSIEVGYCMAERLYWWATVNEKALLRRA